MTRFIVGLLFLKWTKPSCLSLSLYVLCSRPISILVATSEFIPVCQHLSRTGNPQTGCNTSEVEGNNHFPQPAGHTPDESTQSFLEAFSPLPLNTRTEGRNVCCEINHALFPYQYQDQKPSLGSSQALSWCWSRCSFGSWAGVWWNVGHCQLEHRQETGMRSRTVPALEVRDTKTETLSSEDFEALFGTPQSRMRALSTPAVTKEVLRCSLQKPLGYFHLIYFACLRKGHDIIGLRSTTKLSELLI